MEAVCKVPVGRQWTCLKLRGEGKPHEAENIPAEANAVQPATEAGPDAEANGMHLPTEEEVVQAATLNHIKLMMELRMEAAMTREKSLIFRWREAAAKHGSFRYWREAAAKEALRQRVAKQTFRCWREAAAEEALRQRVEAAAKEALRQRVAKQTFRLRFLVSLGAVISVTLLVAMVAAMAWLPVEDPANLSHTIYPVCNTGIDATLTELKSMEMDDTTMQKGIVGFNRHWEDEIYPLLKRRFTRLPVLRRKIYDVGRNFVFASGSFLLRPLVLVFGAYFKWPIQIARFLRAHPWIATAAGGSTSAFFFALADSDTNPNDFERKKKQAFDKFMSIVMEQFAKSVSKCLLSKGMTDSNCGPTLLDGVDSIVTSSKGIPLVGPTLALAGVYELQSALNAYSQEFELMAQLVDFADNPLVVDVLLTFEYLIVKGRPIEDLQKYIPMHCQICRDIGQDETDVKTLFMVQAIGYTQPFVLGNITWVQNVLCQESDAASFQSKACSETVVRMDEHWNADASQVSR